MAIISYRYGTCYTANLSRDLFGYRDISNNGEYVYDRPGLLSPYAWRRIGKNVLLVKDNHTRDVLRVMRQHGLVATVETDNL